MTKKITNTAFSKFCHTKTVGDRAVLLTYLNSVWKNT